MNFDSAKKYSPFRTLFRDKIRGIQIHDDSGMDLAVGNVVRRYLRSEQVEGGYDSESD